MRNYNETSGLFSFIIQTSSNETHNNSEVIRVHLSLGLMRNYNKKKQAAEDYYFFLSVEK
jgi:hypothetical protein